MIARIRNVIEENLHDKMSTNCSAIVRKTRTTPAIRVTKR